MLNLNYYFYSIIHVFSLEEDVIRSSCSHGEIQLVGSTYEGRLEICINEVWGTVCSSGFHDVDASVACFQKGFERQST